MKNVFVLLLQLIKMASNQIMYHSELTLTRNVMENLFLLIFFIFFYEHLNKNMECHFNWLCISGVH